MKNKYIQFFFFFVLTMSLSSFSISSSETNLEDFEFGTGRYNEPFLFIKERPDFLVKSIEYTPAWFLTDTIVLEKNFVTGFNADSHRFSSSATLSLVDKYGKLPKGVEVFYNGKSYPGNKFVISSKEGLTQQVNIKLKIDPLLGEKVISGIIKLESDNIDIINDLNMDYRELTIGKWTAEQEIGWPIMLWLAWLTIIILIIVIFYKIIKKNKKAKK